MELDEKKVSKRSEGSHADSQRFIIQIDNVGKKMDIEVVNKMLSNTGIIIDPNYKPICVNPKINRYVVRGFANSEAQKKARNVKGITLFRDSKVRPL